MADFGVVTTSTQYTMHQRNLRGGWRLTGSSRSGSASTAIFSPAASPHIRGANYLTSPRIFDPFIVLTAAAVATTKLKLGTSV